MIVVSVNETIKSFPCRISRAYLLVHCRRSSSFLNHLHLSSVSLPPPPPPPPPLPLPPPKASSFPFANFLLSFSLTLTSILQLGVVGLQKNTSSHQYLVINHREET